MTPEGRVDDSLLPASGLTPEQMLREDHTRLVRIEQALLGYGQQQGALADLHDARQRIDALERDRQRFIGAAFVVGLLWTGATTIIALYISHR